MLKGVYILFLRVYSNITVRVGSLGFVSFPPGLYAYVGSAQNNVDARIRRHFKKDKALRWHIDYLLSSDRVKPLYATVFHLPKKYECKIAEFLRESGMQGIKNFGASDCRCKTHLFIIRNQRILIQKLRESLNLRKPIRYVKCYKVEA